MTFAVLINIIILSFSLHIIAIIISKDRKINLLDKLQLRRMHLCSLVKWLVIFFMPWTSNSIQTISDMFFRYSKMFSPINLRHNETFQFFFPLFICCYAFSIQKIVRNMAILEQNNPLYYEPDIPRLTINFHIHHLSLEAHSVTSH